MSGCLDWTSRGFRPTSVMLFSNLWTQGLIYQNSGYVLTGGSKAGAFCLLMILHAVMVERLHRMEDSSLSQDFQTAFAKNIARRSLQSFVSQPTSPT